MDSKTEKPVRLFANPFTLWTDAFKTGLAMWASAQAAAARAYAPIVAVIPTADAPAPKAKDVAKPAAQKRAARATLRQPSKAVRAKATRAKPRRKSSAKRHAKR